MISWETIGPVLTEAGLKLLGGLAVLVIGASEDRVVGVQASYDIAEQLQCESFIYEGYGHAAYDEAPAYLTHIKAFLDQVAK